MLDLAPGALFKFSEARGGANSKGGGGGGLEGGRLFGL